MRSHSLEIENIESGVKISLSSSILAALVQAEMFSSLSLSPSLGSEVQAAVHRVPGYSGELSGRQGYQTRPVAPQEAAGRSAEPSPSRLLPESLEDPAEGNSPVAL